MDLFAFIIFLTLFSCVRSQIRINFASPKCHYDSDCGRNAFCKDNSNCVCKAGYLSSNNNSTLCLKEAGVIGDPCIEDIQCTSPFGTRAECFQEKLDSLGRCHCLPGTHFEDKLCYPSISLGGHCQASAECKAKSNASTYCDAGRCVCSLDYHPSRDGTDCLKSSDIGESCKKDDECVTLNSQCIEVCRCKPNYVLSYDSKHCFPVVDSLGSECQEDSQCQKHLINSVCNSITKQCSCSITSTFIDGFCWNIADLGESCSDSRECIIKSENRAAVICQNNKCSCVKGFKPNFRLNDCSGATTYVIINRLDINLLMLLILLLYKFINQQ